jgi:hypothetical protein
LDCEFVVGVKQYDKNDFENRIRGIMFTKGEIYSLKINGKASDKYEIIKVVLSRFGVKLSAPSKQIYVNKKRERVRVYQINYDSKLCNILKCRSLFMQNKYIFNYTEYIKQYHKYDTMMVKSKKIIGRII